MIRYSKYNIFSKIRDSRNYFIVNLLTGNADILTPDDAENIQKFQDCLPSPDEIFSKQMIDKGYAIGEKEESKLFNKKYLDFIDSREKDEVQLFFVTNYSCNFACSYCYQDQYANPVAGPGTEVIDAFFRYIGSEFSGRRKYITVFGGEPLLPGEKQKEYISYLLSRSSEAGLDVCFVTNGYTLAEYVPVLKQGRVREIQVTLDGTKAIHDKRRFLKGGKGTFDNIVNGIDAALQNGLNINLRMVADSENIEDLPQLARFAIDKGWTGNPLFKTQLGRNYELHHCQSLHDKLFTRASLYERIYELTKVHPHILQFYKPAYSISKFLAENEDLPEPLFDSCPACKTEWAFDYAGNIYPCTATVGKSDELLGTFFPDIKLNSDPVEAWESRDVTTIPECRNCSVQLACGGGCGSVAKNRTGSICSTDCRPVKELLELGFSSYFKINP